MFPKIKITLVIFVFLFLVFPKETFAINDPLSVQNNKFGIHILDTADTKDAQTLVNSSGGDWGYVTMVIREDERDLIRWQQFFDDLRRKHLIPIIRLATTSDGTNWKKFSESDIDNWVYFLNSLNWVVKNRYVIIGNEPNHSSEWGGDINPSEYVNILCSFYTKLKSSSDDFFVLPAALDASAPNDKSHMDEAKYLNLMKDTNSSFINCLDGINSHSYPNPGFSASPTISGRGSVKTYRWEADLYKSLRVKGNIPIFITETGWALGQGATKGLTERNISDNYKYAFSSVWVDSDIVAITPFVLNYTDSPFAQFSWKKYDKTPYEFYNTIRNIKKQAGKPIQQNIADIEFFIYPKLLKTSSKTTGIALVRNRGQSIWNPSDTSLVSYTEGRPPISTSLLDTMEPGETRMIRVNILTSPDPGSNRGYIQIEKDGEAIEGKYRYEILTFSPQIPKVGTLNQIKNAVIGWLIDKKKLILNSL